MQIEKRFQDGFYQVRIPKPDIDINSILNGSSTNESNYKLSDFEQLKERLNKAKSQMDPIYKQATDDKKYGQAWAYFNKIIDTYSGLKHILEDKYGAQNVSNAWLKYYELYSRFEIVAPDTKTFAAFFNAELPGASLSAFNHYMRTMHPKVEFEWYASSLAPDTTARSREEQAKILGDQYGLWARHRKHWLMQLSDDGAKGNNSPRNDGDATKVANIHDFATRLKDKNIALYSHDAGIDVSGDFNTQESQNAAIHLGCALAGFETLKSSDKGFGGIFIAKQYTFFETFTWNLLIIYASMFEKFYLCKPLTSRPYNSEIYLVGIGFTGANPAILRILEDRLNAPNMRPFIVQNAIKQLYSEQLGALVEFARARTDAQIAFIDENMQLFGRFRHNLGTLRTSLEPEISCRIADWLADNKCKKIKKDNLL